MCRIIISGYYGFNNFGDDAILHVIVSELKKHLKNPHITVISNNPDSTQKGYGTHSIHKFDFKNIISSMKNSDVLISGGGSLLQDITSVKSLLYYLSIIFLAKIFNVKTYIFAQGIGPLKTAIGKFSTKFMLKNTDVITVRDIPSLNLLNNMGIKADLTSDSVWAIENSIENTSSSTKHETNVGIQLREWDSLTDEKLELIAESILSNFDVSTTCFNLLSLQQTQDLEIIKKFQQILLTKNKNISSQIISDLNISETINFINKLDYMLAMRFHACIISAKLEVPTLALSYDPKVESLATEANMPFINIESFNQKELTNFIKELISNKNHYKNTLKQFTQKKKQLAQQNIKSLINFINRTN